MDMHFLYEYFLNANQLEDNFINRTVKFNQVMRQWKKYEERFTGLFISNGIPVSNERNTGSTEDREDSISIEEVAKLFIEIFSVKKAKGVEEFFAGSASGRLDEMMDSFSKNNGGSLFTGKKITPVERAYFASKLGISFEDFTSNERFCYYLDSLKGISANAIANIFSTYMEQIHNLHLDGSNASLQESYPVQSFDEFKKAMEEFDNPNHGLAIMVASDALGEFLSSREERDKTNYVETINQNGNLTNDMSSELILGLHERLNEMSRRRNLGDKEIQFYFDLQEHSQELIAGHWDAETINNYEAIKLFLGERAKGLTPTANVSQEEIDDLNARISRIINMSVEEISKNAEEIREELSDIVLICEEFFRDGLINALDVVDPSKVQQVSIIVGDEQQDVDAIYITKPEEAGQYLVSMFSEMGLLGSEYYFGPQRTEEEKRKIEEAIREAQERKGEKHFCTQIFNYKRAAERNSHYGNAFYMYDKRGMNPDQILVMATENFDSWSGLYSFDNRSGGRKRFTRSPEEIEQSGMKDHISYSTSEIDIDITSKPSGIGILYHPNGISKRFLDAIIKIAKEKHVPLVIYDVDQIWQELEKRKQQEQGKGNNQEI